SPSTACGSVPHLLGCVDRVHALLMCPFRAQAALISLPSDAMAQALLDRSGCRRIYMSLSDGAARREIHHRTIDMRAYVRDDGLYDVEAHLEDRKPFAFKRLASTTPLPAGELLHDMWVRITVDDQYVVRGIEASSDVTP